MDALIQQVEDTGYEGEMICRIGRNLFSILHGESEPIPLMVEDGLLHQLYRHDESVQRCAILATEHIRCLGLKSPNLCIIEVGAGTGGTTLPILEALSGPNRNLFEHYTFTDISAGFFPKAEETLRRWKNVMDFKALNIEDNPESQGFELGSYDVIIAANVLHATTYIQNTMVNVCSLLKPGGKLYLLESTIPTIHRSFVFGTLPGWWLGSVERKKDSPLLIVDKWEATLKSTGFTGVYCCAHPYNETEEQAESLLISTAEPNQAQAPEGKALIVLMEEQLQKMQADPGYQIALALSSTTPFEPDGITVLGDPRIQDRTCVCLVGLIEEFFPKLDETSFVLLRQTFEQAKEIIWVTCGAIKECAMPDSAVISGLARTIRRGNPYARFVTVDLDADRTRTSQDLADSILHFVNHRSRMLHAGDVEFTERGNQWFVPRLIPDIDATRMISSEGRTCPGQLESRLEETGGENRALRLSTEPVESFRNLCFVDDEDTFLQPLADDEIEISVRATSLNFRDALNFLGQLDKELWGECSGVVVKVGRNYRQRFAPGDCVHALGVQPHASRVRAKGFLTNHNAPNLSLEQAATMPVVCSTVYYSLITVGRLRRGEAILIHAGAGGVGQAAIMLAQHAPRWEHHHHRWNRGEKQLSHR